MARCSISNNLIEHKSLVFTQFKYQRDINWTPKVLPLQTRLTLGAMGYFTFSKVSEVESHH